MKPQWAKSFHCLAAWHGTSLTSFMTKSQLNTKTKNGANIPHPSDKRRKHLIWARSSTKNQKIFWIIIHVRSRSKQRKEQRKSRNQRMKTKCNCSTWRANSSSKTKVTRMTKTRINVDGVAEEIKIRAKAISADRAWWKKRFTWNMASESSLTSSFSGALSASSFSSRF